MPTKTLKRRPSHRKCTHKEKPMTTEIAVQAPEPLTLTAQEIRANVTLIQQVLKAVFVKNVHFGTIPGTMKPTLYKPGAEKILVTFRLNAKLEAADGHSLIEDLGKADERRYRVSVRVVHQVTGYEIGWGVGECSSDEEKYKWKKAYKDDFEATPEDRRRLKYYEAGKPTMQIRTNPADVANTVLKMAKKRALVDATLTCTAASDVFDQDLEDLPEGMRQSVADKLPPLPTRISEKPAPQPEDESQEQPPTQKQRGPNLTGARPMPAKFAAPCKSCNGMIEIGEDMLYIGEGPDKGRYHVAHRS